MSKQEYDTRGYTKFANFFDKDFISQVNEKIDDITKKDIMQLHTNMVQKKKLAPATANKV